MVAVITTDTPEEIVLYRKVKDGGLGLTSSKHKSLAYLIKSFLELAANPSYLHLTYILLTCYLNVTNS